MIRSILYFFMMCFSTWAIAQCPDSTITIYATDFEDGPGTLVASGYPSWEHGVIGSSNWSGASCTHTPTPTTAAASGTKGGAPCSTIVTRTAERSVQ